MSGWAGLDGTGPFPQWWNHAAETAGRMPLTNYLMQSVFGALIFYCWGLGYWLQIGPALCLVLWRVLTYGRMTLRARTSPIHGADGPADAVPR